MFLYPKCGQLVDRILESMALFPVSRWALVFGRWLPVCPHEAVTRLVTVTRVLLTAGHWC